MSGSSDDSNHQAKPPVPGPIAPLRGKSESSDDSSELSPANSISGADADASQPLDPALVAPLVHTSKSLDKRSDLLPPVSVAGADAGSVASCVQSSPISASLVSNELVQGINSHQISFLMTGQQRTVSLVPVGWKSVSTCTPFPEEGEEHKKALQHCLAYAQQVHRLSLVKPSATIVVDVRFVAGTSHFPPDDSTAIVELDKHSGCHPAWAFAAACSGNAVKVMQALKTGIEQSEEALSGAHSHLSVILLDGERGYHHAQAWSKVLHRAFAAMDWVVFPQPSLQKDRTESSCACSSCVSATWTKPSKAKLLDALDSAWKAAVH